MHDNESICFSPCDDICRYDCFAKSSRSTDDTFVIFHYRSDGSFLIRTKLSLEFYTKRFALKAFVFC
ncbi:hypothetical protein [Rubritalea tangerina]|uniref:hypothetical protein n=1 Tax=Rubritalea tangerina TaxID=430798 RepID=UPI0036112F77